MRDRISKVYDHRMKRPCNCNRYVKDQPFSKGQCRLCWLHANDPRYAKLWDETCPVVVKPKPELVVKETTPGGKLIGSQLKEILTRFGVPPCSGCDKRAEWLDNVHRWLLRLPNPEAADLAGKSLVITKQKNPDGSYSTEVSVEPADVNPQTLLSSLVSSQTPDASSSE